MGQKMPYSININEIDLLWSTAIIEKKKNSIMILSHWSPEGKAVLSKLIQFYFLSSHYFVNRVDSLVKWYKRPAKLCTSISCFTKQSLSQHEGEYLKNWQYFQYLFKIPQLNRNDLFSSSLSLSWSPLWPPTRLTPSPPTPRPLTPLLTPSPTTT